MNAFRLWVVVVVVTTPFQLLFSQDLPASPPDTGFKTAQSWTVFTLRPDNFLSLPGRSNQYYLPLLPGVVEFNRDLHVRGSRSYENTYVLGGFNVTNPVTNSNGFELIPEATEKIEINTGPAGANQYSANGSIVTTEMKQGGERLAGFAEYRTDDFVKAGGTIFGTVPLGANNLVVTVGGPAIDGIRFFLAGQYRYVQNNQAIFLEPFRYEGLTDDGFQGSYLTRGRLLIAPDSAQRGIVEFKRNTLSKNWSETQAFNGHLSIDLHQLAGLPLMVQLLGVYGFSANPTGGSWPFALTNYYRREERNPLNETRSSMVAGRLMHALTSSTSYEFGVSYQHRFQETYDPNYGRSSFEDYLEIPDSAAAAARGFNTSEWRGRYTGPYSQSVIFNFIFTHPETPNNAYSKNKQTALGLTLDLTSCITPNWQLKVGGRLDRWTLRQYSFNNIRNLLSYRDPNRDGNLSDGPVFATEYEKRVRYIDLGNIVSWGYTYRGDETDGHTSEGSDATLDRPYKPLFASAYAEGSYRDESAVLRFGLRYEYFDSGLKTVNSTAETGKPDFDIPYDYMLGIMDESVITTTEPFHLFLPRVSLAVPLGKTARIYAAFGQYAQMPPFELLMQSNARFSQSVSPPDRSKYSFGNQYVPAFPVKPERSTQYEAGASIELLPNISIDGTLYYKALRDQIQMGKYYNDLGEWIFSVRTNEGYGTAKGAEVSVRIHPTQEVAIEFSYAMSAVSGLTSNPVSNVVQVTDAFSADTLLVARPLDYRQTQRATLRVDLRTPGEEGPVWGDIGASAVLTFNSGHRFTKEYPEQNIGSASPWNIGVRTLIDPRVASWYKAEPTNSSETPNVFNVDVRISKGFSIGPIGAELYVAVLNLFDTKKTINVYPSTGGSTSDGWYQISPYYFAYEEYDPLYSPFYKDININNRWAYTGATGHDLYSAPRQFRVGLSVRY